MGNFDFSTCLMLPNIYLVTNMRFPPENLSLSLDIFFEDVKLKFLDCSSYHS